MLVVESIFGSLSALFERGRVELNLDLCLSGTSFQISVSDFRI